MPKSNVVSMNRPLSAYFDVESRFVRSVNPSFDIADTADVPTYTFGPKSYTLLEHWIDSTEPKARDRAWFVVAPYGSGKSIFALFATIGFSKGWDDPWMRRCRERLQAESPEVEARLDDGIVQAGKSYVPVLVHGQRGSIECGLLHGLRRAMSGDTGTKGWARRPTQAKLKRLLDFEDDVRAGDVVEVFQDALADAGRKSSGLIIAIDEFGKYLENAAMTGGATDLFVLQSLAELAARAEAPQLHLWLLAHQNFDRYVSGLPRHQTREWEKIQGRFREFDFTADPTASFRAMADCLRSIGTDDIGRLIRDSSARAAESALEHPAFSKLGDTGYWQTLFERCYPLHPLTIYLLPRLSGRAAQNERSIYTFLCSTEPYGLKDYLSAKRWNPGDIPYLTADRLYDYFVGSLRQDANAGIAGRRYIEIDTALGRLGDRPDLAYRVVKTIGLLNLVGLPTLLAASEEMLAFALNVGPDGRGELRECLDELVGAKILVFRRFANEYRVWEGSDFDVDARVDAEKESLQASFDAADYLGRQYPAAATVARRHSHKYGITRFYQGRYVSVAELKELAFKNWILDAGHAADGLICYVLCRTSEELETCRGIAESNWNSAVICVLPKRPLPFSEALLDFVAIQNVLDKSGELRDDAVAQRELSERLAIAEAHFRGIVGGLSDPNRAGSTWHLSGGEEHQPRSAAEANRLVSTACDQAYPKTPVIRNEMINRNHLSGTIVTARKRLIQCILQHGDKENLGIEGFPPEMAIYRGVLRSTGIHARGDADAWTYKAPTRKNSGLHATWREIEKILESAVDSPRQISDVVDVLSAPPYGLRSGVIPILLFVVFASRRHSVALYDGTTFIREWAPEVVEKLLKSPDRFFFRYIALTGRRALVMSKLSKELEKSLGVEVGDAFESVLRAIYRWMHGLPAFALKSQQLSETTIEVRRRLMAAKAPEQLMFEDLPNAVGCQPIAADGSATRLNANDHKFVSGLTQALSEVNRAYPELLARLVNEIKARLGLVVGTAGLRKSFKSLQEQLYGVTNETQLKAFLLRAADADQPEREWVESVSSVIRGTPPAFWRDDDEKEFVLGMSQLAQKIRDAQSLKEVLTRTADSEDWSGYDRVLVDSVRGRQYEQILQHVELNPSAKRLKKRLYNNVTRVSLSAEQKKRAILELLMEDI